MSWRVHLANQAIQHLHVIPHTTPLLAVWTRPTLTHVYDLETGALLAEMKLPNAPIDAFSGGAWQTYLQSLMVKETGFSLPYARTKTTEIFLTDNGKMRLYFQSGRELIFDDEGEIDVLPLDSVKRLLALEFDRQLAHTVCIDDTGKVHIFYQKDALGVFDLGLNVGESGRALLAVSRGGNQIFVSDGRRVVLIGTNGKPKKEIETHFDIGRMACSPSGSLLAISDRESGILRAYKGDDLLLTHQKFAIELIATADKVQLLEDLPPINTAISALTAFTQGMVAFAMSGMVCMSDVTYMDELPRVR